MTKSLKEHRFPRNVKKGLLFRSFRGTTPGTTPRRSNCNNTRSAGTTPGTLGAFVPLFRLSLLLEKAVTERLNRIPEGSGGKAPSFAGHCESFVAHNFPRPPACALASPAGRGGKAPARARPGAARKAAREAGGGADGNTTAPIFPSRPARRRLGRPETSGMTRRPALSRPGRAWRSRPTCGCSELPSVCSRCYLQPLAVARIFVG